MIYPVKLYGSDEPTSRITITNNQCLLSDLATQSDLISLPFDAYFINPLIEAIGETKTGAGDRINDPFNNRDTFRIVVKDVPQSSFQSPYEGLRAILNKKKKFIEFTYDWDFDSHKANSKCFPVGITEFSIEPEAGNKIINITAKRVQ